MATTWTVDGVDLRSLGVEVLSEEGLLDLAGAERELKPLRGSDRPAYFLKRRERDTARLELELVAGTEAELLFAWGALKDLLSPARGEVALTRSDLPGRRLLVR
jgi:hypothetical protein